MRDARGCAAARKIWLTFRDVGANGIEEFSSREKLASSAGKRCTGECRMSKTSARPVKRPLARGTSFSSPLSFAAIVAFLHLRRSARGGRELGL